MTKFNQLPKEIKELVSIRFKEYHIKVKSTKILDENVTISQMFSFSNTIEGHSFWSTIATGNYEIFYEKYPKIETRIELISDNPIIYKGIVNNKKVKITIEYED